MVETSFNLFDMIVIAVVGLSALLSFFRGFIREILSLGAWVVASLITLYSFLDVAAWIEPQVKNSVVASGLAAMGTFIASLIMLSILNALLMRILRKGEDVGALDNALGLVFGVMRAMLLLSFAYFALTIVSSEEEMPAWVTEARTREYVAKGAELIGKIAPDYLKAISNATDTNETIPLEMDDTASEILQNSREQDGTPGDGKGQEWMNVDELDRMIKQTQERMKQGQQEQ